MTASPWLSAVLLSTVVACNATEAGPSQSAATSPAATDSTLAPRLQCDPDAGKLTLPEGFCAWQVADGIAGARQIVVSPRGDLLVAAFGAAGIWALRDADGDGIAEDRRQLNARAGHGLRLHAGYLYSSDATSVVRYAFDADALSLGVEEPIVVDLPRNRHGTKSFVIFDDTLFVNIGSPSNACQEEDRALGSPGKDPCEELETTAGIWGFSASAQGQPGDAGRRLATGMRHTVALAPRPGGGLYAVIHGRDRLAQSWPQVFDIEASAELPSEEFVRVADGDDLGWPYCFHDPISGRKLLAPEYGGDGTTVGRCAAAKTPIYGFPAHWAPNGLLFYDGDMFPDRYRQGAFVAFHGSWNREPLPQGGYNVAFLPLDGDTAVGTHEIFADGFAGATVDPASASHRPVDLAQGPDGSLYVSDDAGGSVWRIVYNPALRDAPVTTAGRE